MVKPGTWVTFPHRPRKKFYVRDHYQTYLKMRPGSIEDYADRRNYDDLPGTRLRDSSGRTYVVDSSKFVIER